MESSLGNCYVIIISGKPVNSAVHFSFKIFNLVRYHLEDDWEGGRLTSTSH